MLAQYTYFKRRDKTIRLLPETLNLAIMVALCYCLKELVISVAIRLH